MWKHDMDKQVHWLSFFCLLILKESFFLCFSFIQKLKQGGDLIKWDKAKVGYYVGVDIADGSVIYFSFIHVTWSLNLLLPLLRLIYFLLEMIRYFSMLNWTWLIVEAIIVSLNRNLLNIISNNSVVVAVKLPFMQLEVNVESCSSPKFLKIILLITCKGVFIQLNSHH